MADQVITKQELIDAQKDAQTLEDAVNGGPGKLIKSRTGREFYSLASVPQINTMTREEVTAAVAPKANRADVETALSNLSTTANKYYSTLAAANADIANIALNQSVTIGEEANSGLWEKKTAGATSLTKSPYDPLTQAKAYTDAKKSVIDENLLYSALSRQTSKPNLFPDQTPLTGVTVVKSWKSTTDNSGIAINVNGVFASVRLGVSGGVYPNLANDPAIFSGALRLQIFEGGTLRVTRDLLRLRDTDIWYFWDSSLIFSNITEIKIFAYGVSANNIILTLDQFNLQVDGKIANYEVEARKQTIALATQKEYESYLLSLLQPDSDKNLLGTNESGTAPTTLVLSNQLSKSISKYSAVCVIDGDGTYPTSNDTVSGFKAKIEIVDGAGVARKAAFLKRIGTSKVWYVKDAIPYYESQSEVKLTASRLPDGSYVSVSFATITENSLPNPIFQIINNALDINSIVDTITPLVTQEANSIISSKIRPTTAFEAIAEAANRRVDIIGIGDSNQLKDGYGFDQGFRKALANKYGLYATPPLAGGTFGVNAGAGDIHQAGAIASVDYRLVADGTVIAAGTTNGLEVGDNGKYSLNPTSRLVGHFKYATFSDGVGSFKVGARREDSGYGVIRMGSLISTNTGLDGSAVTTLEVPADSSRSGQRIGFKWIIPNQTPITGKFISYFMRVEDADKKNGVCISPLYNGSGQSLYDAAVKFNGGWSLPQLTNYFYEIRRLQLSDGLKPIVVIYINMGLNDQNETLTPSQGWRASTDPQSATAYLDNLEAVAKRIEDVWQVNGWDEKELYWWVIPSHPTASPDSAKLRAYRKAASSFAMNKPRASFVDFENLTSYAEMLDSGWYLEDGLDVYHLNSAGYDALSSRLVSLIP